MELNLNNNDKKLLGFCMNEKKKTRQIAEHLGIAIKNVLIRLDKLKEAGLIEVEKGGVGKKTFIRTIGGIKTKQYYLTLLSEIKKRGGVTNQEYLSILPIDLNNPKERDKFNATMTLQFITPRLIEQRFFITKEGEKYLKNG